MKLYVVLDEENQLVAICEEKKIIKQFIKERNKNYSFIKIKDNDMINKLLIDFDDLYLEYDDITNRVFTRIEFKLIKDFILEEKYRIKSLLNSLEFILSNYKLDKKTKSLIKQVNTRLSSLTNKDNFFKAIGVKDFIKNIYFNKAFVKLYKDISTTLKDKFYIFINK